MWIAARFVVPGLPARHGLGMMSPVSTEGRNILGEALEPCGFDPLTGFWRDGSCRTGGQDMGVHAVCAVMTEEFLAFSASAGNDL